MKRWQPQTLSAVLTIQNGFAFNSKQFTNEGGMPLIRIRDLKGGLTTEINYIGEYDRRYLVKAGDFLIGMDGEFGCYEWSGPDALLNQRVCKLTNFKHGISARYLFYGINSHLKAIEDVTSYTTVKHISSKQILGIEFPFPPLEEQQRIVAVLDEAFAAIATATANAEKNLSNARELFDATVRETFACSDSSWKLLTLKEAARDFGRGKSKHRPRNDPKLYGGKFPFIQTGDVRNCDHLITDYSQSYSEAGLAQSKLWPKGTICITIAANIAETGILNFDACFPDSVIGMVADPAITSNSYVEYLLQSLKSLLQSKGKGSAQANINLATFENERFPFPPKDVQIGIVARLGALSEQVQAMEVIYADKLQALAALKQSLLHRAFSGELPAREAVGSAPSNDNFVTPQFAAQIVAFAFERHVAKNRAPNFGTVKAEKILHMVEALGGIDLGRRPTRQAAGPDDAEHRHATWDWARSNQFFQFVKRGSGHDFTKLSAYATMIVQARSAVAHAGPSAAAAVELLVDMDTDFAELVATTHAAWNNLLNDDASITEDAIVRAARDDWHPAKLKHDKSRFHDAIRFIRKNGIVPDGSAKRVGGQENLLL